MSRYFNDFDSSECLEHSQRPGAKWGERNGPPYPLDRQAIQKGYSGKVKDLGQKVMKLYPSNKAVSDDPARKSGTSGKPNLFDRIKEDRARKQEEERKRQIAEARRKQLEVARAKRAESVQRKKALNDDINSGDPDRIGRKISEMSDAQLQQASNRMQVAQNIRSQMTKPQTPAPLSKAERFSKYSPEAQAAWKSGDPNKILKYKDEYSTDDLGEALTRAKYNAELQDKAKSSVGKGWAAVDNTFKHVSDVNRWVITATSAYNTLAMISNVVNSANTNYKHMPVIPLSQQKPPQPQQQKK